MSDITRSVCDDSKVFAEICDSGLNLMASMSASFSNPDVRMSFGMGSPRWFIRRTYLEANMSPDTILDGARKSIEDGVRNAEARDSFKRRTIDQVILALEQVKPRMRFRWPRRIRFGWPPVIRERTGPFEIRRHPDGFGFDLSYGAGKMSCTVGNSIRGIPIFEVYFVPYSFESRSRSVGLDGGHLACLEPILDALSRNEVGAQEES